MRGDSGLRISHVGLRGIVGRGLTAGHILDFAAAFGTFLEPGRPVVVGRDPRASGRMAWEGVVSALMACGHTVIDLGVVSTPVVQHALQRLDAAGGIAISASHNAAEWNALRFLGPRGTYLSTAEAGELLDIYHLRKFRFVEWDALGGLRQEDGALDRYLDDLAVVFDLSALRRFRVVVDCCNGTSALILRRMVERYGLDLVLINERVEGVQFAHEPTTSARMVELQLGPLMKPLQAHAGFLFDVDSDRVAMADELGRGVSEEMMLPLLADHQLTRGPGKIVITNLSSSALVEDIAAKHGGRVLRVPVGRQAAMDALAAYRPEQIAVAGEGTGAVMMPQFRFIYDGIASMLAVLTMMQETGRSLAELLAEYPRYSILKGEVRLESPRVPALLVDLLESYPDGRIDRTDGLRVSWPNRWFHVRVSHTEPIIRVICEQRGEAPVELFETLMDKARSYS
ncbi:MAG TPA: hypothetical protein VFQ91_23565 [Bryobacteraceae bacterium]|nr:hypothetical protein [Bryobacteraceae bacterium]